MAAFTKEATHVVNRRIELLSSVTFHLEIMELCAEELGRDEGMAIGKRDALLTFLKARKLTLSLPQEELIQKCTKLNLLDRWIRRAATASSVDEVLRVAVRAPRKAETKQKPPAARRRAGKD